MSDDLSDRNRERLNQATGDRLSRQTAKSDRDSQMPLPSQSAGYRDGRYWQQRPGHKPLPVTAMDTNGGIEDGQPVTMRGNRMDAMPRVRPELPTIPQPRKQLLIKYLYSLERSLYVGGWQPEAVEVYTLQTDELLFTASLDNLGGDLWRVDLVTVIGATTYLKTFTNAAEEETISLTSPDPIRIGELYGFGFSFLSLDSTLTPVPPSGSNISFNYRYVVKGGFQFASGVEVRRSATEQVYYGSEAWYGVTRATINTAIAPIPLTPELSYGFTLANTSNLYIPSGGSGLPPVPENSDTLASDNLTTVRIDRTGRFAIGRYVTSTDFEEETSGLLWIADSAISRTQSEFAIDDHYLDVQTTGFTAIPKTELATYATNPLNEELKQTSVVFNSYSPSFRRGRDLETLVYPPKPYDRPNFVLHTASYHE